jgi:protein SCO1/2
MGTDSFTENSLYQLNSKWKNQFNNNVELKDLKGKINVISMIFANCSYACPILVNDMRKIESALSKNELRNVQFTLISIDPERDTPKRLKQFAEDQNLNLARWKLLTGSRSDIDDFAVLLGFRYKKENDGSYSHSNIITLLDEEGEIIHQHVGLNEDVTETISLIKEKVNKGV